MRSFLIYAAFIVVGIVAGLLAGAIIPALLHPHSDGTLGEGFLVLGLWSLFVPVGLGVGALVATQLVQRRSVRG